MVDCSGHNFTPVTNQVHMTYIQLKHIHWPLYTDSTVVSQKSISHLNKCFFFLSLTYHSWSCRTCRFFSRANLPDHFI